ncbi:MAG: hypothetical protein MUF24_14335 [Chitinophagaceae bacterium]|jgi:hypothetical protein|nr:hypothetical protein [Chitinophagaceae bacterium]
MGFQKIVWIIGLSLLKATACCYGQDKVITLQGDTLIVQIPRQPTAVGLPRAALGKTIEYGFRQIAVSYRPDSVRMHLPGQIAGYIRQNPGRHSGTGIYLSKKVPPLTRYTEDREPKMLFMQRIGMHGSYSFWYFRLRSVYGTQPYYMLEHEGSNAVVVETYSQFTAWVQQHPALSSLLGRLPASRSQKRNPYALFSYLQLLTEHLNKQP